MIPEQAARHLEAALKTLQDNKAELERRRAELDSQLAENEAAIQNVRKTINNGGVPQPSAKVAFPFVGFSVRFAILKLFSEGNPGYLSRNEIAQRLQQGGVTSKGKDFFSNISAVLSQMKEAEEMVRNEQGWNVTQRGREVWADSEKEV